MMTASETLIKAKELLDTRGWCRDLLIDNTGQHCAIGGIMEVSGGSNSWVTGAELAAVVNPDALDALVQAAGLVPGCFVLVDGWTWQMCEAQGKGFAIATYNNSRKDYSQIAAWFDRAIELAQAKEMYAELNQLKQTTEERKTDEVSRSISGAEGLRQTDRGPVGSPENELVSA